MVTISQSFVAEVGVQDAESTRPAVGPASTCAWREGLPTIKTPSCTLRELTPEDAPSLFAHLTREEVSRFISPPPASVEGFEQFIRWSHRRRAEGTLVCFGIVPVGQTRAVGMFQVQLPGGDEPAEWGFVLGSTYWGTGIFLDGAERVLNFVFTQLGVRRLEARAVLQNGRGNGALLKAGAVRERVLRGSFERHGKRFDQGLWIITAEAWAATREWPGTVH